MSSYDIHSLPHWPCVSGPRRNRKGQFCSQFFIPAIWMEKVGIRERNHKYPALQLAHFRRACQSFESMHGERAANDYRDIV
jgi:hypothetical protein